MPKCNMKSFNGSGQVHYSWCDKREILEEILNGSEYLNLYSNYLMFCPAKYHYHVF